MTDLIDVMNLRELLARKLVVPAYQRGIVWTKEQYQSLGGKLARGASASSLRYVGTVVLAEDVKNEVFRVVDGQQRLTALSCFYPELQKQESQGLRVESVDREWYRADRQELIEPENIFFDVRILKGESEEDLWQYEIETFLKINAYRQKWRPQDIYFSRLIKYLPNDRRAAFIELYEAIKTHFLSLSEEDLTDNAAPMTPEGEQRRRRNFLAFLRLAYYSYRRNRRGERDIQLEQIPTGRMRFETLPTTAFLERLLPPMDVGNATAAAEALLETLESLWENYRRLGFDTEEDDRPASANGRLRQYLGDNWLQMTVGGTEKKAYFPAYVILNDRVVGDEGEEAAGGVDRFLSDAKVILRYSLDEEPSRDNQPYRDKRKMIGLRECLLDRLMNERFVNDPLIRVFKKVFLGGEPVSAGQKAILKGFKPNLKPSSAGFESIEHFLAQNNGKLLAKAAFEHRLANLYPASTATNSTLRDKPVCRGESNKCDFLLSGEGKKEWTSLQLAATVIKAWNPDEKEMSDAFTDKLTAFWSELILTGPED